MKQARDLALQKVKQAEEAERQKRKLSEFAAAAVAGKVS